MSVIRVISHPFPIMFPLAIHLEFAAWAIRPIFQSFSFSPEANQTTSISVDFGGLTSIDTILNNSGNFAEMVIRAWGEPATVGTYVITVTATDDFMPTPGVILSFQFTVVITPTGTAGFNPILDTTGVCDSVLLSVLNDRMILIFEHCIS